MMVLICSLTSYPYRNVLFWQRKWPGYVLHHVSAIPGERYWKSRCRTHFISTYSEDATISCPIFDVDADSWEVSFEVLTTELAAQVAFGENVRLYFSKEGRKNHKSCYRRTKINKSALCHVYVCFEWYVLLLGIIQGVFGLLCDTRYVLLLANTAVPKSLFWWYVQHILKLISQLL